MVKDRIGMKEIHVQVKESRYKWLKGQEGSMSNNIRNLIDQRIFEQLYLKGTFAKQNTKNIKRLMKMHIEKG